MIPKFRAWHINKQIMCEVIRIDFKQGIVTLDLEPDDDEYYWTETDWNTSHVILMQSTGLQDKNGKDIFEGDIVAFEDSDGGYEYQHVVINTGIVEYGDLGFYFTNRVAVEMDDFYIKDGRCDDVEVIGNMHENQELLGDTDA